MLYVYTSCDIIGPKVDWSAWGAREDEEVEAEGLDRNCVRRVSALKNVVTDMKMNLALELSEKREGHPSVRFLSISESPVNGLVRHTSRLNHPP